jgi:hypothetical protein
MPLTFLVQLRDVRAFGGSGECVVPSSVRRQKLLPDALVTRSRHQLNASRRLLDG